jgi:hypothetical protein
MSLEDVTGIKTTNLIVAINSFLFAASAQQTLINYLSGTDKDHTQIAKA